ncbi:MAG TPA: Ig-like domain-containing protein, partial [Clostridia bacterium]|nr:Ig-like domain-containing protein [Clostridia bacterium]
MRNLKKVFAAIIIVTMVLSTMMVSVFADENTNTTDNTATVEKTAGDICKELGVLKGGSNGVDSQYLATATQRIQAAIIYLRMLGLEDEARAFQGTDNFTDASVVANVPGATNILAYLKANPDLGWVGDGKKFSPTEQVSAQQLYKVMLTVLGYEQGADFDYNETLFFAKFVGMSKIANVSKLNNANLATALVETLGTSLKGGGPKDTLVSKLVNEGLIAEAAAEDNGFDVNVNKIVSVAAPAAKEVAFGTTDLGLPSIVKATLTDGSTMDADVTWDMTGYNANKAGKVTIKGTVEGFEAGVTVDVTVKAFVLDVA